MDYSLSSSALGTKQYWDDAYADDLENFEDNNDAGEVWFGKRNVAKVLSWIKEHSSLVPLGCRIVDFGCGNGYLLVQLAKEGYANLVGLDYSPSAVCLAEAFARTEGCLIRYVVADLVKGTICEKNDANRSVLDTFDLFDVGFDRGSYDAVSLTDPSLYDVNPREAYLNTICTLLHPGSLFIITSCNWTEVELKEQFKKDFSFVDQIAASNFQFGGRIGSSTTTLVCRRL